MTRAQVDAQVWKGLPAEVGIVRDVRCANGKKGCEEFLPASHRSFERFRCMVDEDLNRLIEQALKRCK